jgi:hypothetical protein
VRSHGEGVKNIVHPREGAMALEYTAFVVESEPDLRMIVYTPANDDAAEKILRLLQSDK